MVECPSSASSSSSDYNGRAGSKWWAKPHEDDQEKDSEEDDFLERDNEAAGPGDDHQATPSSNAISNNFFDLESPTRPKATIPTSLSDLQFHDPFISPSVGSASASNRTQNQNPLYSSLKSLRSDTLSLSNRLKSIVHDSKFVDEAVKDYGFPVMSNERCGSWYLGQELRGISSGKSKDDDRGARRTKIQGKWRGGCYFKSTDGHWGAWGVSLRRLNLKVLDILEEQLRPQEADGSHEEHEYVGDGKVHGLQKIENKGLKRTGVIIVDSTRRGKAFPDALSKTVPIWCAVINRICFGRSVRPSSAGLGNQHSEIADDKDIPWWYKLQYPRGVISGEEATRIELRLSDCVRSVKGLEIDIKTKISRPLRCFWIMQDSDGGRRVMNDDEDEILDYGFDGNDENNTDDDYDNCRAHDKDPTDQHAKTNHHQPYHSVILLSSSRRVLGAEISERGYVQGAGDDAESWSHGLTPEVFWENYDLLMSASEELALRLTENLVNQGRTAMTGKEPKEVLVQKAGNLWIGVGERLANPQDENGFDLVINCHGGDVSESSTQPQPSPEMSKTPSPNPRTLNLHVKDTTATKLGSRDLRTKLSKVHTFISSHLHHHYRHQEQEKEQEQEQTPRPRLPQILITCNTGKNLSIGVALVILCLFYTDNGTFQPPITKPQTNTNNESAIDKTFIRKRLAWITESMADANPSRSTLQAVNSFLFAGNGRRMFEI